MSLTAFLFALAAGAVAPAGGDAAQGTQVERVRVSVEIVRPVIVRQASGIEQGRDSHRPQITRRGREVLYEFE